jgi:leucyl aminopeptidase
MEIRIAAEHPGADALVVGLQDDGGAVSVAPAPGLNTDLLTEAFRALAAGARAGECTTVPAPPGAREQVIIGVGLGPQRPDLHPAERLRRAAGAAARAARGHAHVAYALPASDTAEVEAVVAGAHLGAYSFDSFKTSSAKPARTTTATVVGPGADVAAVRAVTDAVNLARDLVNTPPNRLRPGSFATLAEQLANAVDLEVSVLGPDELREGGFGGLTGVGQGSTDGPRLVRIAYRSPGARRHLAIIGKGITFDSGGLSLKPAKSMETMKCDMAGAAAVLGALIAIARLAPAVQVTGWLALAENMPGGGAQRPGDVIAMYGGTTVEVLNTDAEGRLVMADALVRAGEEEPDAVIDIATLTGAQMVALGPLVAGAMGNDAALRDRVVELGGAAGESLWAMPLPPELRPDLDSPVADLQNIGGQHGGMLTAGLFLQEFVPAEMPWVHLDVAGPAFNTGGPAGYTPKGGTGFGVRTLVAAAQALAAGTLLD